MTILLVDGDQDALDQETKRLQHQQFAVTVSLYSNAEDAIRFAIYHDLDLVLTRAQLPQMSGQALVETIHRFKPELECHILPDNGQVPFEQFVRPCRIPAQAQETADHTQSPTDSAPPEVQTGGQANASRRFTAPASSQRPTRKRGDRQMTEQELRSLSRKELLEIMIEQGKTIETNQAKYEMDLEFLKSAYEKEIASLQAQLEKERTAAKAECQNQIASIQARHEQEIQRLNAELEKAQAAVKNREIILDEAGSIAVAALQLNGIFEAAQAASQQYLENIRSLSERQASLYAKREAEYQVEMERRLQETTEKCKAMEAQAKQKSDAYWAEVSSRLQAFYDNHQELKKLLQCGATNVPV